MKTKFESSMEEVFDLADSPPITTPTVIEPVQSNDQDLENDYKYARENLYGIIEKGASALDELVAVAQASEHPRAYEVVGQLVRTLTDANKDLLKIQKDVKELKGTTSSGPTHVTNALFVGNTAELQKLVKQRKDVDADATNEGRDQE